jgi:phage head maturation protease
MAYTLTCAIDRQQQKSDEGNDVYHALASTDALDRDGDVMLAEGCIIEEFMKNPVMLFIHNYRQVPVAKVLSLDISPGEVAFDFTFAETDVAKELKYLYDDGFMNAFSVGFYPKTRMRVEEETPDKFNVDANGTNVDVDLAKYKERPRQIICSWELLEVSPVPVPANPGALLLRAKDEIVRKFAGSAMKKSMISGLLDSQLDDVRGIMDSFIHSLDEFELQGAVPGHTTPVDMETAWDGSKARVALAKWASSDGSGNKDKMNWAKFSKGFGWFDSEKLDSFTSYKLPHHIPKDGSLVAIWRGLAAGMAALLGSRGGVDVGGDNQKVYNHFAKHYRDADKPVPEFGRTYTETELKSIEDGTWEPTPEEPGAVHSETPGIDEAISRIATLLEARFDELEDTFGIRLSILEELLKESATEGTRNPPERETQAVEILSDMNLILAGAFSNDY